MAILVTRPQPDTDTTAAALRARGLEALPAPMLRFTPVAFRHEADAGFAAVIVTSANAVRAVADQPQLASWRKLPLFAVGARTATAARDAGFADVISADGDADALRDLLAASLSGKRLSAAQPLLYLAGADLARDLAAELAPLGLQVTTLTTYRMAAVTELPAAVIAAFAGGGIEAVLHYSRRSARAFVAAARLAGVEISALAIPQCCLSEQVAAVLREAGATQVMVAARPDENALFAALDRALIPLSR